MTLEAPAREEIAACRDVVVTYGRGEAARNALDGAGVNRCWASGSGGRSPR